jgi:ferredoxin--NADP+ reductase
VGRRYLQDYFASGAFEDEAGFALDPKRVHVFLCGNPTMIGAPLRGRTANNRSPKPKGMVEVLEQRGFMVDDANQQGNIHYEKYW